MKEEKLDIYPAAKNRYEKSITSMLKLDISKQNKDLLLKWIDYLKATGIGKKRIAKLISQAKNIFEFEEAGSKVFTADFATATVDNITKLVSFVNFNEERSEATKADYRKWLKQFYRWFKDNDDRLDSDDRIVRKNAQKFYNHIKNDIKRTYKQPQIDPSTILTNEDIEKVIKKGCRTPKERALIKFLHETGLRAGELLGLKLKHIELKKNLGLAHVDGKTGKRTVEFATSMGYMSQYIESHPERDNHESYLWLGENNRYRGKPMIRIGIERLITRCFIRAEVEKKRNPHWFRHSRASLNAPYWTEVIMCKYFGWVMGSKQVKTYVHLCQKDVETAFLKMNGLQSEEEVKQTTQTCGCGMVNDSFQRYCGKCGNPLQVATALQDQELVQSETGKAVKEMMAMMQNPELMKAFMEFKKNL